MFFIAFVITSSLLLSSLISFIYKAFNAFGDKMTKIYKKIKKNKIIYVKEVCSCLSPVLSPYVFLFFLLDKDLGGLTKKQVFVSQLKSNTDKEKKQNKRVRRKLWRTEYDLKG